MTMDTSKMLHFEELNNEKIFDMYTQTELLKKTSEDLLAAMDVAFIRSLVVDVASQYDIGTVKEVYEIFGGYVNRSFGILTEKDGQKYEYFMRLYKRGITEKEINFEHFLIDFAKENGLEIAAGIIRTKGGNNFVKKSLATKGETEERYFAIYQYLPGEDKYTWVENEWNDIECASAAEVLATFHNSTRHFDPKGLERAESKIMELLPTLKDKFQEYANTDWNDKFTEYFHKNLKNILDEIDATVIPADELAQMAFNPIHCDYHPGNLKFTDNRAVGIFDFDWSKIDLRLFDIGLGLVYCCSSWVDELDGTFRMDQCEIFLKAYQNKLKELNGLAPLNEVEKKHLPTLLAAGNMYLIFWALRDYYGNLGDLNVYEYLTYLKHQVKLMNYIRKNWDALTAIANSI